MDVSTMEKMARSSRQMMIEFLKKNYPKSIADDNDNELVKRAKSRFHSIIVHIFEGEYLYFLNPLSGSNDKPDIDILSTKDAIVLIDALAQPRDKLYKLLESRADQPNEPIAGTDMSPNLVYFWLVEHDAWHHGQMELLVETIEKGSLQPAIVFEEEPQ